VLDAVPSLAPPGWVSRESIPVETRFGVLKDLKSALAFMPRSYLFQIIDEIVWTMPATLPFSFSLDLLHRRLLRGGEPVPLGDRAFDLLAALAAAGGEAVAADSLMAWVWPGVTVTPGNLRVQVRALRRALGDAAVQNVPGVGYRLALSLTGTEMDAGAPAADTLLGREAELERLRLLLSRSRLVTIVGPGGVGKTSLALAGSRQMQTLRAVHVELAPVAQADLLPVVTAASMALRLVGPDVKGAVLRALAERPTLLLLDNAEHLLDEVAGFAEELLGQCPDLRILLTSREPLGLTGEQLLHLCPLECPPEGEEGVDAIRAYPAVRLVLREHGRAGWPPPPDDQMPALARLCRHLDGLPLALLLLAAWMRDCPVTEVERVLSGRFQDLPLPAGAASRHDNLHHMLRWSVEALSADEKLLLGRLTVFAGAWPVEAAAAVCGSAPLTPTSVPGLVAGLVARSLVAGPIQTRQKGLRLLETIRHHVIALDPGLVERETLRPLLCRWLSAHLRQYMRVRWLSGFNAPGLNADVADIRAMLNWAFSGGDVLAGQELAIDSYRHWNQSGPFAEIADFLMRAWSLCGPDTPPAIRAILGLLLHGEGVPLRLPLHADRSRYAAEELDSAVAALRGDDVPPVWAIDGLISAGFIRRYTGDQRGCLALWDEAVGIAERYEVASDIVRHRSLLGWLRAELGEMEQARADFARALAQAERHGLPRNITLLRMADAEFNDNQIDRAIEVTQQALISGEPMPPTMHQTLLANLASYLLLRGRVLEAVRHARDALTIMIKVDYTHAQPWALERGALLALTLGRPEMALMLATLARRIIDAGNVRRAAAEREIHTRLSAGLPQLATATGEPPSVSEALTALHGFYEEVLAGIGVT